MRPAMQVHRPVPEYLIPEVRLPREGEACSVLLQAMVVTAFGQEHNKPAVTSAERDEWLSLTWPLDFITGIAIGYGLDS
jgi:hypothetical protein